MKYSTQCKEVRDQYGLRVSPSRASSIRQLSKKQKVGGMGELTEVFKTSDEEPISKEIRRNSSSGGARDDSEFKIDLNPKLSRKKKCIIS